MISSPYQTSSATVRLERSYQFGVLLKSLRDQQPTAQDKPLEGSSKQKKLIESSTSRLRHSKQTDTVTEDTSY